MAVVRLSSFRASKLPSFRKTGKREDKESYKKKGKEKEDDQNTGGDFATFRR